MAPTKTTVPKSAPSDLGLQSTGDSAVDQALMNAAEHFGVPPAVMFATAQQESGLNPNAVGDEGTSFGLFQEHEGGELNTVASAENPVYAANLAASNFAAMAQQMPNATWGQIVAASQRPANQGQYAANVNGMLGKAGQMPAQQASKALGLDVSKQLSTPGSATTSPYNGPLSSLVESTQLGSGSSVQTNPATEALSAYAQLGGIVNSISPTSQPSLYNQASTAINANGIPSSGSSPQQVALAIQQSYSPNPPKAP